MKFDVKSFKSNIMFFIIAFLLLVFLIVVSVLSSDGEYKLEDSELTDNEVNIDGLVINEIMTSNKGTLLNEDGKLYDYVELYNGTPNDINLKNYGLSDDTTVKWIFPEVTIKSKEYLIVFLSGNNQSGLVANFKLSSAGGETLTLFKPNGKVVDATLLISLVKDTVMARNEEGTWVVQTQPTPGFANTIKGHEEFLNSLMVDEEKTLVINEILPNNKGQFRDSYGNYSEFIEIKNIGKKTIDLKGYSLSNDEDKNFKWQFPDIKIGSGDIIVVFATNKNITEGELHASFKLNNENGVVVLSNNQGKIIDKLVYNNVGNGFAYALSNGNYVQDNNISAGYENNASGIAKFQDKYMKNPKGLIINEVMNSNYSYLPQNGGNYYDWIELYNNSGETIKLNEYYLSTSADNVKMYNLPNVELKKDEYYILIASGDENLSNKSYKHTNFNISKTQSLYLTKNNKIVDSIFVANVPTGYSMGKGKSSGVYYFSKPTPKGKNGSGTQSISAIPQSNYQSGIYNDTKNLKVTLSSPGTIYYTTDGSEPTKSDKKYSSPLTIKETTVLKIKSFENDKLSSETKTLTFVVNENHKIDIMSITIEPKDLNAIHRNAWTEGYEKKAHAEFLELDGSGFEIDCGLKLFGGSTRGHAKKSYEIKFKKQYGEGELNYHVFEDKDYSVFNSLVLRTGSQDEMGTASKKTIIKDLVVTSLVDEYTSVDVQAYRPVAMYLNGKYWGLYFIREKIDETLVSNHYNVQATKTDTDILRIDGQVKTGSATKYKKMVSFINSNSLSKTSNYNKIKEQINLENLADYWIAETWTSNNDIVNCRYFSNPNVDNGRWHYIFYDLDFSMYNTSKNYYQFSTSSGGMGEHHFSTVVLRNLMKNSEFKKLYTERLSYNLKNTWSSKTVLNKIDEVIKEISIDEIKRNLKRWNMSYSQWEKSVEYIKTYTKKRNSYMVSQAKSFLGLSKADMDKYFGDVK